MDSNNVSSRYRRYKSYLTSYNLNLIHKTNPLIPAWWSVSFPGLGHMMLGMYFRGIILFIWEFFININTNLNMAIIYSFTGKFELAKEVVDIRWLAIYLPIYISSIWDSYLSSVEINKLIPLVERENVKIVSYRLDSISINFLQKRRPFNSIIWSLFIPGLGHLYVHRIPTGFFLSIWSIASIYFSRALVAIHYTVLGEFSMAVSVIDPEWFLFLPSIYLYAVYDAYRLTVEYNRLFNEEQTQYLEENYQNANFEFPI